MISYGRLVGHYWLRLERKGNTISGATSPDGTTWTPVGSITTNLSKDLYLGLVACSRLTTVSTTARFDKVSVTGWPRK